MLAQINTDVLAPFTPGIKMRFGQSDHKYMMVTRSGLHLVFNLFCPLSTTSVLIFFKCRVYERVNVWVFPDLSI